MLASLCNCMNDKQNANFNTADMPYAPGYQIQLAVNCSNNLQENNGSRIEEEEKSSPVSCEVVVGILLNVPQTSTCTLP